MLSLSQVDISNGSIIRVNNSPYYVFDSITVDGMVKDIIKGDECKETQDSLYSIIKEQDFSSQTKSLKIKEVNKQNSLLKNKLFLKDEQLEIKDKRIYSLERKNKWNKIVTYTLGGIALVETIALTTILILK